MVNPVAAGFVAGGVLARNAGPKAAFGGGIAFAAFSAAIDLFLRRETPECVSRCSVKSDILIPRVVMIDPSTLDLCRLFYTTVICRIA